MKLASDIYPPWRNSYIFYDHLKDLLRENDEEESQWEEKDESAFVEALDNELEKVYGFQMKEYRNLMAKLDKLENLTATKESIEKIDSRQFQHTLEDILAEAQELDNFSRINYTGFVKIVKKHDKLHPAYPSVKSLLSVRLQSLPFNSEEYSPLLYRISYLYNILRNSFVTKSESLASVPNFSYLSNASQIDFKSYKFWIHNDNLMEVKTTILRHLPLLLYAAVPTKGSDSINQIQSEFIPAINNKREYNFDTLNSQGNYNSSEHSSSSSGSAKSQLIKSNAVNHGSYDPIITTIYFDNDSFELYNNKLLKTGPAPTLRLRWIGKLSDSPDVFLEKRLFNEDKETGNSEFEEKRLQLKTKYINGFIFDNDKKFHEHAARKMKDRGISESAQDEALNNADEIQKFVNEKHLKPLLRAVYNRTAFQIPGDDRIRITIDSDILYIREDALDRDRPTRQPRNWHRLDLDSENANPLKCLRSGEYSKFPYSVMEIKIKAKGDSNAYGKGMKRKDPEWIEELINSHLVKQVPKFSIYLQGVASLYGDNDKYLDTLPFWLTLLDSDIKKDPQEAYEEEKSKLMKQKQIQVKIEKMNKITKPGLKDLDADNIEHNISPARSRSDPNSKHQKRKQKKGLDLEDHESTDEDENKRRAVSSGQQIRKRGNIFKRSPFLNILAGNESKLTGVDSEDEEIELPAGVKKPDTLLKNVGANKVEAKVWLANERTFNKWLSVTTLLSVLTFSIYNSTKKAQFPKVATTVAYVYFALTVFCALWSYKTYLTRLKVINERSGQHLDAPLGPILVAITLAVTLILNFAMSFRSIASSPSKPDQDPALSINDLQLSPILKRIEDFIISVVT